jgi:two-component system LytT family response regulator
MIKVLIVDDEIAAAKVLQLMIARHIPEAIDIRIAAKITEAGTLLQQFQPELVFMDIMMPEKNGFEFLSQLKTIDFEIIFATAYDEYAIKAIRFSALDYLLKPINADELKEAVNRFLAKRNQQTESEALLKNLINNLEQKKESDFKLAIPTVFYACGNNTS